MAHNETEIGQMIRKGERDSAAEKLLAALRAHYGNTVHTALSLAVSHATMKRWLVRLDDLVHDKLIAIRSGSKSKSVSLSRSERNKLELKISHERAHNRLLSWISSADEVSIARIAKDAKCRSAQVIAVGEGLNAKRSRAILEAVSNVIAEQRDHWRKLRLEKAQKTHESEEAEPEEQKLVKIAKKPVKRARKKSRNKTSH